MLVSVIASSGSTPRGPGATMLVFEDGHASGTIGGGAVEHAAVKHAAGIFCSKDSVAKSYNLSSEDVSDLGMVCGGGVTLYFQYLNPNAHALIAFFQKLCSLAEKNENAWMVRHLKDGMVQGMGLVYEGNVHHIQGLEFSDIKPHLKSFAVLTREEPVLFVEPIARAETVYVFGGGHVSQKLVPVLVNIGFRTIVFEERFDFADPSLFPGVEGCILGRFADFEKDVFIRADDYVVIMTRGHQSDYAVLRRVLNTDATYIGCIGSRHKIAATRRSLLNDGFDEKALTRIHSPIGLQINAVTPEEIAISIAAEMIDHRAKKRESTNG